MNSLSAISRSSCSRRARPREGRRGACRCPVRGPTGAMISPASMAFASSPASIATSRTRCGGSRSSGEREGVFSNLVPATRVQIARAGGAEIVAPRPPPRLARGARPRLPLALRLRDRVGNPTRGAGALRRSPAAAADELRGASLRRVRAPELVGVLRGADAVGRLRQVPRRRAHAHAWSRPRPAR